MKLELTEQEQAWRNEVASYLRSALPADYRGEHHYETDESYEFTRDFAKQLGRKNWLSLAWPEEFRREPTKTKTEQALFQYEIAYNRAPTMNYQVGSGTTGPALIVYGTQEQRDLWLEDIRLGNVGFCNGLTEPDAGSDLAALKFSAVDEGDEIVLNGEKIFNTRAHRLEYITVAVRSDPTASKYRGISAVLCPLDHPNVKVVKKMTFGGQNLSWVYFDDVRVPMRNRIGTKDQAWYQALSVDVHTMPGAGAAGSQRSFDDFVRYCREKKVGTRRMIDDDRVKFTLAEFAIELEVQHQLYWRTIWARDQRESGNDVIGEKIGGGLHQASTSVLSLWSKEWGPRFSKAAVSLLGPFGQLTDGDEWAPMLGEMEHEFRQGHGNHAHGTPELLKNVMAHRGLGMPR